MLQINPKNYKSDNIIYEEEKILEIVNKLKKEGKRIGLCTGSFDLIHPGHVTHLVSAKKECDVLIIGLAKDSYSSNKDKESGRPIFSEDIRAFMVSKLKPVDFVTFDDGSPNIVEVLKPDIYIKGSDYANETNPGIIAIKKVVMSYGGEMHYTPDEKFSTSKVIKHIKEEIKQNCYG